jgi:isoleucyl-tRNA synthetase
MFSNQDEKNIKQFWEENNIPNKVRERKTDNHYYFIDGPPYASGKIHLGTAMNRILKDIIYRYKRQQGYQVLDIPGFDCHGVPIERKVQKKHDLKSKEDIEKYGVEKFIQECHKFATEHIGEMSKDIYDLGQWMDWKKPYKTLDQKYMLSAWWTFKQAFLKGLLYSGKYPIYVCPECETSVSFNEIEYKDLTDTSIYACMQSLKDASLYFVIWTTTPWTLPANMGIMVHPKYEYVELIKDSKKYVVAKELVEKIVKDFKWDDYSLGKTYLGEELVGEKYKPILEEWLELPKEYLEKGYKIISSPRFVHLEEGSGLVHCAPGHGKEDYQVGKENDLPAFSPVTISGEYDSSLPKFKGQKVKELDPYIIEYLEEKGSILGKRKIEHSYPTCWRCHFPLLQISLPQWFLRIDDKFKERLKEINKEEVTWFPSWGKDRFNDWLTTLSDWPISRARFWGIPIPLWNCEKCGEKYVFGSLEELKEKVPEIDLDMDIHKPYIDRIEITCKCGEKIKRIPEIFDVWYDSGVASWASLNYPSKKELFEKYWPPDMNLEGLDQIRGWWNSQIITSAIVFDKSPFKHVSMHGMILDGSKKKLSKSEGNDRPLIERFSETSIDYYRYYFAKEFSGEDMVLDENKFKDVKKVLTVLENIHNFINMYTQENNFTTELKEKEFSIEDRWILSKFNSLLKECYENYENTAFSKMIYDLEKFVLEDFSRVYIKLLRKKKKTSVLEYVYSSVLLILSPVIPHFTEHMYLKTKHLEESIHLSFLPKVNEGLIDKKLEENFLLAQNIIATSLSLRESEKKRLRWILPRLVVSMKDTLLLKDLIEVIKEMANVESVEVLEKVSDSSLAVKEVVKDVFVFIDKEVPLEYQEVWEVSELIRLVQSERKVQKLNPKDKVSLKISCDDASFLEKNKEKIEDATNTSLDILDRVSFENKQKLIEREVSFSF